MSKTNSEVQIPQRRQRLTDDDVRQIRDLLRQPQTQQKTRLDLIFEIFESTGKLICDNTLRKYSQKWAVTYHAGDDSDRQKPKFMRPGLMQEIDKALEEYRSLNWSDPRIAYVIYQNHNGFRALPHWYNTRARQLGIPKRREYKRTSLSAPRCADSPRHLAMAVEYESTPSQQASQRDLLEEAVQGHASAGQHLPGEMTCSVRQAVSLTDQGDTNHSGYSHDALINQHQTGSHCMGQLELLDLPNDFDFVLDGDMTSVEDLAEIDNMSDFIDLSCFDSEDQTSTSVVPDDESCQILSPATDRHNRTDELCAEARTAVSSVGMNSDRKNQTDHSSSALSVKGHSAPVGNRSVFQSADPKDNTWVVRALECEIWSFCEWISHNNALQANLLACNSKRNLALDEVYTLPWKFYSACYSADQDLLSTKPEVRTKGIQKLKQALCLAFQALDHPNARLIGCILLCYFYAFTDATHKDRAHFVESLYAHVYKATNMGQRHPITRTLDILANCRTFSASSRVHLTACLTKALHKCCETEFDAIYEAQELHLRMLIAKARLKEDFEDVEDTEKILGIAAILCNEFIEYSIPKAHEDPALLWRAWRFKAKVMVQQRDFAGARKILESLEAIYNTLGRQRTYSKEWAPFKLLAQLNLAIGTEFAMVEAKKYSEMAVRFSQDSYGSDHGGTRCLVKDLSNLTSLMDSLGMQGE